MIRVLIADDQKLLRESFKVIIENNSDMKVIASAENGKEAYELCDKLKPDVVLMDIYMPVCDGTEATKLIKSKYPKIKVLILSASDNTSDIVRAMSNGADGYILKNIGAEELVLSIKGTSLGLKIMDEEVFISESYRHSRREEKLSAGKTVTINGLDILLTLRELEIIQFLVEGKDNKEIGASLFIAEGTVKNIITEIISKLHLKDRAQLAVFAIKNNLV